MNQDPQAPSHIFPIVEAIRNGKTLILQTTLRKKHTDGKYYYWNFESHKYISPEREHDWTAAISSFNRDLYLAQMHGKIDPSVTFKDGTPYYTLCENQIDEKERMDPARRTGGAPQPINNKPDKK
jgi:hypothetical protein